MAYSINTDNNLISFKNITNGEFKEIIVSVDGSDTNNSYYIGDKSDYEWFTIERKRNLLIVRAEPNFTTKERIGYFTCVHNLDTNAIVTVEVKQDGTEYGIEVDTSKITFPEYTYKNSEVKIIVKEGSEEYYIKEIKQFTENDTEVEYDKGLVLNKEEDNILKITSYGRIFVDKGGCYEIHVAHKDNRFIEKTITVNYEPPKPSLDNFKEIKFTYNGNLSDTDDNNVREIVFKGTSDYGYTINIEEDLESETYKWLHYTENPTSITVTVDVNDTQNERKANIIVKYSDDAQVNNTISVIQEPFNDFNIDLSDDIITFEKDEEGTFDVSLKVYGDSENNFNNISGTNDWCKLVSVSRDVKGVLFNQYTVTFEITSQNTSKDKRETTLSFTHPLKTSIKKDLKIIQYGTNENEDTITNVSVNNNTIVVMTNPKDSQIVAQSTAVWCEITINDHNINVNCKENLWDIKNGQYKDRQCKIMVQNAEMPNKTMFYTVKQAKGVNFSISFDG